MKDSRRFARMLPCLLAAALLLTACGKGSDAGFKILERPGTDSGILVEPVESENEGGEETETADGTEASPEETEPETEESSEEPEESQEETEESQEETEESQEETEESEEESESETTTEGVIPSDPEETSGTKEYSFDEMDENALVPDVAPGNIISEEMVTFIGADKMFWQKPIDDEIFARIYGKSYKEDCIIPREDLRYMQMLHYDLEGNIHVGEMISNKKISETLLRIFRQLYDAHYPIEKMVLVDEYDADDEASSSDNNTSCFNFRRVAMSSSLSRHARGLAVNINPLYNPYIISGYNTGGEIVCTPAAGKAYLDRTQDFPYKIDEDDLCTKLFKEAGFTWGGDWQYTPDYMHFDLR